jgi:hypothetical protein
MQLRLIPAFILFLGSYFPLSVILILQDVSSQSWKSSVCRPWELRSCSFPMLDNPAKSLTFIILCALSLIFFFWLLRSTRAESEVQIEDAVPVPNDLINYVFPYVVSFMGLDIGNAGKFYGFLVFLIWMFIVTYRSGQILMNPLLLVAGWQLYQVRTVRGQHSRTVRALSRFPITPGDTLKSCVVQGVYIFSKDRGHRDGSEW